MGKLCSICGLHAEPWRWDATVSGRFTCRTPNTALSLPRSERHEIPREATFISTDYAAIERRLAAGLGDEWPARLRGLADEGVDVHTRTAALVFEVPEAEVTPEMRSRAKVINFGALYSTPATRARAARIALGPEPEAKGARAFAELLGMPRTPGIAREPYPKDVWTVADELGLTPPSSKTEPGRPITPGDATPEGLESPARPEGDPAAPRCAGCGSRRQSVNATGLCISCRFEMVGIGVEPPPSSKTEPGRPNGSEDGAQGIPIAQARLAAVEVPASQTCSGGRLAVLPSRLATRPYVPAMRPLYCPICGKHRTVSVDLRRFLHTGTVKHRPCAPCMRANPALKGPSHRVGRPR